MIKKFIILVLPLILSSCSSARINAKESYLFEIGFMGEDLENQSIDLYVDNALIFKDILLKEIPYNVYVFDIGVGYKKGSFELYSLRNGSVLKSKSFEIKDLDNIEIDLNVDKIKSNQIINIKKGKYYHVKLENEQITLIQLKSNRID